MKSNTNSYPKSGTVNLSTKKKKKRTVNLVPFHMLEGNLLFGENGRSAQFIQQS